VYWWLVVWPVDVWPSPNAHAYDVWPEGAAEKAYVADGEVGPVSVICAVQMLSTVVALIGKLAPAVSVSEFPRMFPIIGVRSENWQLTVTVAGSPG